MKDKLLTVPNTFSLMRLAGIPVLWIFALEGKPVWVGVGTMLLFITDMLDGLLARSLNQVTELGARLDSLADNILVLSALIWLILLRGEILQEYIFIWFSAGVISTLLMQSVTYIRFKRYPPNLHLYSAKVSGFTGAVFIMYCLAFNFVPIMFFTACSMFILSNVEGLIIVLTRSEVNAHMGSLFKKQS